MMSKDEFDSLCQDIAKNGLIEPIWTHENKIIDGRNRFNACEEVGVKPEFREWSGDGSLVAFVVSLNLHRRHLTSGQRAVLSLDVLPILEKENPQGGDRRSDNFQGGNVSTLNEGKNRDKAAEMFQTNNHYVQDAKKIQKEAPELLDKVRSGELSLPKAKKKMRTMEIATQRQELATAGASVPKSDKWNVYHADMKTWQSEKQYDFIITDPPYPRDYLSLYEDLAMRSHDWLKPGGLLIAMAGQSYLDEIYEMMSKHLVYYWTAAYLTPGQPTPLRQRNVNTTWKPLLIYSKGEYKGKIFGDVFKSDGNDKEHHKWGQSVSGMSDIISKICLPGQSILDPFCGAGTTGIAALKHSCFFDGIDNELEKVNISKGRINDTQA